MSARGILAYGAYVPRLRLRRQTIADAIAWVNPGLKAQAKGERAICDWDEDSLTMAVEAARDCRIDSLGAPDSLALASTTLPFADRDNAAVVVEALELPETIKSKVMEDAAALMRDIALQRGRNVEKLEATVLQATTYSSQEAVDLNVVDFIAVDFSNYDGDQQTRSAFHDIGSRPGT